VGRRKLAVGQIVFARNDITAFLSGHPITIHAADDRQEVLKGLEVEGVVIVSFPSFEEAKASYDSQAYQEARAPLPGGRRLPCRRRRGGVIPR
jgi:hypothetical protein